jgi:hypothetical protein
MCAPWDVGCVTNEAASKAAGTMFGQIAMLITGAEQWLIDLSASWWVMVPSISLYPKADNTDPNATPIAAVANLHALIMPIAMIVAVGGMLWNGLIMVLSRKPAPLVNVLRGLWNTALWAAVGIFGTQLLLAGTDEFSRWVITSALKSVVGNPSFSKRLSLLLIPVTGHPGGPPVGMVILVGGIATVCAFIQAILMLFRDGSVLILAAVTPLAAAGSFTNATNGWKNKLLSWQLALIFYKAFAALVYATMIWLQGENTSTDPRVLLFSLAMLIVALVALPALLRFFNWTIGSLQNGGGGLGMVGTAAAAGMHAAATLRGAPGGQSVTSHARYLDETFNRGDPPPTGRPDPGPGPGPNSGSPHPPCQPTFIGHASASGAAPGAAAGAGASADAAGAGSDAVAGAAAATGPAAPAVLGAVAVTGAVVRTGKAAADAAADAASDSTKD